MDLILTLILGEIRSYVPWYSYVNGYTVRIVWLMNPVHPYATNVAALIIIHVTEFFLFEGTYMQNYSTSLYFTSTSVNDSDTTGLDLC